MAHPDSGMLGDIIRIGIPPHQNVALVVLRIYDIVFNTIRLKEGVKKSAQNNNSSYIDSHHHQISPLHGKFSALSPSFSGIDAHPQMEYQC